MHTLPTNPAKYDLTAYEHWQAETKGNVIKEQPVPDENLSSISVAVAASFSQAEVNELRERENNL